MKIEKESISWYLLQILKPTIPTRRMVFHEITRRLTIKLMRLEIDMELVQAQETRRILDNFLVMNYRLYYGKLPRDYRQGVFSQFL